MQFAKLFESADDETAAVAAQVIAHSLPPSFDVCAPHAPHTHTATSVLCECVCRCAIVDARLVDTCARDHVRQRLLTCGVVSRLTRLVVTSERAAVGAVSALASVLRSAHASLDQVCDCAVCRHRRRVYARAAAISVYDRASACASRQHDRCRRQRV
jgi:hypothetical protein